MNDSTSLATKVRMVTIKDTNAGQRVDNFLMSQLKGVPKSRIYRLIRKGEVRVNKKRVDPETRLAYGDEVRIPPVRLAEPKDYDKPSDSLLEILENSILYEDDDLLIINKPVGLAVHAGSSVPYGVIEALRHMRPYQPFLELAHRLDRDTSGCLVLAKSRTVLLHLHEAFKDDGIKKYYQALVHGVWPAQLTTVDFALLKGQVQGGERMVKATAEEGKASLTKFKVLRRFATNTLMEARLYTGRTHQIRVHAAESGYPIVGDTKYGNRNADKPLRKLGAKGMYLHSASIEFGLPNSNKSLLVEAPMPESWQKLMQQLDKAE